MGQFQRVVIVQCVLVAGLIFWHSTESLSGLCSTISQQLIFTPAHSANTHTHERVMDIGIMGGNGDFKLLCRSIDRSRAVMTTLVL